MADAELSKSIKKTQDSLGKYVKKPPLTEKNLSRPPFRFLHDITTTVINGTGFMKGVFTPEELDSTNVTTREAKTEFMKKLIGTIAEAVGEESPVKISKILAGQEADKTNLLLQHLAQAIEKSGGGSTSKTSQPVPAKAKVQDPKEAKKRVVDAKTEKKVEVKAAPKKADSKAGAAKNAQTGAAKSSSNQQNKKPPSKLNDTKGKKSEAPAKSKDQVSDKSASNLRPDSELDAGKSSGDAIKPPSTQSSSSSLKRQNSSIVNKASESSTGIPEAKAKEESSIPTESRRAEETFQIDDTLHEDHIKDPTFSSQLDIDASDSNLNGSSFSTKRGSTDAVPEAPHADYSIMDAPSTSQSTSSFRPGTATRLGTARPPSARPAPPRPKSSLYREPEESNYRPPTGKVTNVLLDNTDGGDDDDNFVVREAAAGGGHGLADLDEAPELALTTGSKFDGDEALALLAPEDRGLLVDQILEAQKELEHKDQEKGDGANLGADKIGETSKAEIEKLKNLLQDCARNANPLGKLLDYVREDIDTMQKEVSKWRQESTTLDAELENAKGKTEASLQPLQQQLAEAEALIADKEDAIAATKLSILRLQERIEKILSGLDRVQSSHGKLSIPSASQLFQNDNVAAAKIRPDSSFGRDDQFSSGFSASLNRIAQSTPGMRPASLFATNADDDDLDPDNFDPFKA